MRDPLGLNERLFAFYYPRLVARSEEAGLREIRAALLAQARGRTLELGAGSGLNIRHYSDQVTELILSEPSPHMLDHLRCALDAAPPAAGSTEVVQAEAEHLLFAANTFDTVVGTFVLCTVPDPRRALAEVARVLRPEGRYLFLEHVHAGEGTLLGRIQDLVEVPHRYLAAGCHPNRRTAELIGSSPLQVERMDRGSQPRAFPTVRPMISGTAQLAGAGR